MTRNYPTADLRRCQECGVLPGRDHLARCQSPEARRIRREWEREEERAERNAERPTEP